MMEFFVHLEVEKYGSAGWAIPAATLPGARLKRLLISGRPQDLENDWILEGGYLRVRKGVPPKADGEVLVALKSKLVPAWIPVIASVLSALIAAGATVWTKHSYPPLPQSIIQPQISLGELTNENRRPIDKQAAPFKVFTSGTVSDANVLFTCLVVDDQNREWVEPGCRKVVGNRFDGIFYLGEGENPYSLGKQYKLFAVVSKSTFGEYKILDRGQVLAVSEVVKVRRTRMALS